MKKQLLVLGLMTGLFMGTSIAQDCSGDRYHQPIFAPSSIAEELDVKYGSNFKQDGTTVEDLYMDIYYPDGAVDSDTDRPLVLLAHGGSFIGGSKEELTEMCKSLASLGYVSATISYRLLTVDGEVFLNIPLAFKKEVVRAIHDMKAAIRYFRKSYDEGNPYGINPDIIVIGGFSAGAILSNHVTYMDSESKVPSELVSYVGEQGGLEGNSGNPGYSSTPQMTLSFCGAILDTTWMESNAQPYFGMHNLDDPVVPNLVGEPNIGLPVPVTLQGDSVMYVRAQNVGIPSEYKSYPGNEHCVFPANSSQLAIDFAYDILCVQSLSLETNKEVIFSIYPNPTSNIFYIDVPANEWNWNVSITNMLGQVVHNETMHNNQNRIEVDATTYKAGIYMVSIISPDGKKATKKLIVR